MGRPGQCSLCQCAVVGIGLPGSHTAESSTLAIAGIGTQQATSGYSLGGNLSWSSPAEGWEWEQAEVSSLLKGLPAGRMTLLGGWKVPGTPRPPSFWIPWYSSVLNHSRDRHAGTTHMIRACWGGETALARWCFFVPAAKSAEGRVCLGSQGHGSLWWGRRDSGDMRPLSHCTRTQEAERRKLWCSSSLPF